MQWQQFLGPLGGGIATLIAVLITVLVTSRHKARDYRQEHLSRLIEKRYELYMSYVDVLDKNVDIMSGADSLQSNETEVLQQLHSLEHQMYVFAGRDVLGAFEAYRECLRKMALEWENLNVEKRGELLFQLHVAGTFSLAMVRADLEIDSYDSWRFRRRRSKHVKGLMKAEEENLITFRKIHSGVEMEDSEQD